MGLFGYVGPDGSIRNVGVVNTYFCGSSYLGGVVAINGGAVSNCYNAGTVSGGNIIGGVVGRNNEKLINCYNTGTVIGNNYLGGVMGDNYDTATGCYSTGNVTGANRVGGVVGSGAGCKITDCYSTGNVSGTDKVGGVVGGSYYSSTIANCYFSSDDFPGAAIGHDSGTASSAAGKTNSQFASGEVTWLLNSASHEGVWKQTLGTDSSPNFYGETVYFDANKYTNKIHTCTFSDDWTFDAENHWKKCTVEGCDKRAEEAAHTSGKAGNQATCAKQAVCDTCWQSYGDLNMTVHGEAEVFDVIGFCPNGGYESAVLNNGVYEIFTAGNLFWFARKINSGSKTINGRLTANIVVNYGTMSAEATDVLAWTPIGMLNNSYNGTFDGNSKTVSGLFLINASADYADLFGYVGSDGEIRNVGVMNSYIHGHDFVGGIAGQNEGTITQCYSTGNVRGANFFVGGIVGRNDGTLTSCHSTGSVTGDDYYVGGVVGYSGATVANCCSTGAVSGGRYVGGVVGYNLAGTTTNCYSTGSVGGYEYIGGVVGCSAQSTVTNCYFSSDDYAGNAIGHSSGSGTISTLKPGAPRSSPPAKWLTC